MDRGAWRATVHGAIVHGVTHMTEVSEHSTYNIQEKMMLSQLESKKPWTSKKEKYKEKT